MSAASEWLSAIDRATSSIFCANADLTILRHNVLRCADAYDVTLAYLMENGDIWIAAGGIPAAYRNKFVRWILDTFAEPEQLTIRAVESAGTV